MTVLKSNRSSKERVPDACAISGTCYTRLAPERPIICNQVLKVLGDAKPLSLKLPESGLITGSHNK